MSTLALAFTQFPIQWIPEAIFPKIKQLVCEDDQLLLPSTKICCTSTFGFFSMQCLNTRTFVLFIVSILKYKTSLCQSLYSAHLRYTYTICFVLLGKIPLHVSGWLAHHQEVRQPETCRGILPNRTKQIVYVYLSWTE